MSRSFNLLTASCCILGNTADRNLLFEERSRSRGGEAAQPQFLMGTQEAIRCRCAHGKQLASALLGEVEMLIPFQGVDQGGQERHQACGTDAIGSIPGQEQRVLDFWPIMAPTRLRTQARAARPPHG